MGEKFNRGKTIPKEIVVEKLKQAVADISKRLPLDAVYLYGSYANGRPKFYSDVDVVVVSPAFGANIVQETAMLMELFEGTGLMVEPRAYSREEFKQAEAGSFLYEEVIKKGLQIL